MKRYIFILTTLCMLTGSALAQTLAFDDIGMKYGYKNSKTMEKLHHPTVLTPP